MDWKLVLQIAGVVLGLLYLGLEYRADIRLWIVGLIMPLVHGALCRLLDAGLLRTGRPLRVDRMA